MSESTNHKLPNQEKWIKLSKKELKAIFIYYILLFICALCLMIYLIYCFSIKDNTLNSSNNVVWIMDIVFLSFICGLLGSTFYYIRKLYKSCIQQLVVLSETEEDTIQALGAKIYFYFRPIMGAVLALFIVLGIYGGFFVLLEKPAINSEKFYLFVAIIAFLIGFSNGKIIVRLDNNTYKIAEMFEIPKEGRR